MTNISITQERDPGGWPMQPDKLYIEIRIPGWSAAAVVLGLRLVAAAVSALGEKFTINELEVSKVRVTVTKEVGPSVVVFDPDHATSLRLHMPVEHQVDMMAELQRVMAPSGDDHDELNALERWVREEQIETVKRHWRNNSAAAELAARLLCVLEIMHTLLDNPGALDATLVEWRRRRKRITESMGS